MSRPQYRRNSLSGPFTFSNMANLEIPAFKKYRDNKEESSASSQHSRNSAHSSSKEGSIIPAQ